jgi:hypothetical protein
LMDIDGIETHPISLNTLTDFDRNWTFKTSFRNRNLPPKGNLGKQLWSNFDRVNGITLTKFSLCKFSVKNVGQAIDENFDRVNGLLV